MTRAVSTMVSVPCVMTMRVSGACRQFPAMSSRSASLMSRLSTSMTVRTATSTRDRPRRSMSGTCDSVKWSRALISSYRLSKVPPVMRMRIIGAIVARFPGAAARPAGLPFFITLYRFIDMNEAASLYRLLGEAVRLRLLRVLARERLNVTELTAVLGLAQSGVSRHLGLLKEAGLVAEEPAGGFTYYRLAPAVHGRLAGLWSHLESQFDAAASSDAARADDARLQEVLRLRRENFETHGADAVQLVPGRSWAA